MLTDERCKQLMAQVGMPNSISLMQALRQCDMEATLAERTALASAEQRDLLRDYFAAAALQGWLASFGVEADHPAVSRCSATVAHQAYVMADAMLEAREASKRY